MNIASPVAAAVPAAGVPGFAWSWSTIALAAGLAALGGGLLVLLFTRWGQVRPIAKCVVLSVFAHLLLLASACGIRLFHDLPTPAGERIIKLSLIDPGDEPARPELPEESPEPPPVEPVDPALAAAAQDEPAVAQPPEPPPVPHPSGSLLDVAPELMAEAGALPAIESPVEPPAAQPAEPPVRATLGVPSVTEMTAQPPVQQSAQPPVPSLPESLVESPPGTPDEPAAPVTSSPPALLSPVLAQTELHRLPSAAGAPTPSTENAAPHPPRGDAPNAAPQRLSDPVLSTPVPSALADEEDRTVASDNGSNPVEPETFSPSLRAADEWTGAPAAAPPEWQDTVSQPTASPLASLPHVSLPSGSASPEPLPTHSIGGDLPSAYRSRSPAARRALLAAGGGHAQTEAAVVAALRWLATNQNPDGRWECGRHGGGRETRTLGHDRGGAGAKADTAATGLAILAFLGFGQTHLDGPHAAAVQHGLEFLARIQATDGSLAGEAELFARMYCHGMATLALGEAYGMTGDQRLRPFLERALHYSMAAQNPRSGGWRYQPGDEGDTSQLGWQLMAFHSAELAGLPIPTSTRAGMIRFLNSVSAGPHRGLASYLPRSGATRAMTAEALACRIFLGLRQDEAAVGEAVAYLLQETPQNGPFNEYYWYYATMALFQLQGEAWQIWNSALQQRLLASQETAAPLAGSWPTDTVWGGYGGRIYTTAMNALCLEVYYRHLPLYGSIGPRIESASR